MSDNAKLFLWDHPVSSYAQKVRIALREKGIPFESKTPTKLGSGENLPDLAPANPRLEVPALVDGDMKIFDSKVILQYIEDKYPEPSLLPHDPALRADAGMIQEVCDAQYEACNWGFAEVNSMQRASGELADKLNKQYEHQIKEIWNWLEGKLGEKKYFNGAKFGLADLCVFPVLNRSAVYGFAPAEGTALQKWFANVKERPSVKETGAEMKAGLKAMASGSSPFKPGGGYKREYRNDRLEWMIKSGGIQVVIDGLKNDNIRFSWPFAAEL